MCEALFVIYLKFRLSGSFLILFQLLTIIIKLNRLFKQYWLQTIYYSITQTDISCKRYSSNLIKLKYIKLLLLLLSLMFDYIDQLYLYVF
jgi:hypothetical protein